jgi:hypothetical protein
LNRQVERRRRGGFQSGKKGFVSFVFYEKYHSGRKKRPVAESGGTYIEYMTPVLSGNFSPVNITPKAVSA